MEVVGEHGARTDEDVVLQRDPGVDAHVVLDLHAVTDASATVDEHVLAQRARRSHQCTVSDVGVVPDRCAIAERGLGLHHGGRVHARRKGRVRGVTFSANGHSSGQSGT
jgi:hypothetical protein